MALGTYVTRGKESLVAVRAYREGLVLHQLYFADEVRDYGEIDTGKGPVRREEVKLALRLVEALKRPTFDPQAFEDTYRARVEKAAREKARGKPIREEQPAAPRGHRGGPDGGPPEELWQARTGERPAAQGPARDESRK